MSVQNPNIPTPTQAKGIDAAVYDLQAMLDTSLSWLTNGFGRAYRLTKVEVNRDAIFLPEVRLNDGKFGYFACTPDNDKQGQNFFIVGDGTYPDYQENFFNLKSHPVSIIFSANLETIDSTLLATEDYTEDLIEQVETALRQARAKSYKITSIDSVQREFDDVFAEFDVASDRGIAHNPMTHFRFNLTVQFRQSCPPSALDRCTAILQNLSQDELLNCILPTYDFSDTTTQNALTGTQVADLTAWLCGAPASVPSSMVMDGINENCFALDRPAYDFDGTTPFSYGIWFKSNTFVGLRGMFSKRINLGAGWVANWNGTNLIVEFINTPSTNQILIFKGLPVVAGVWYRLVVTYDGSKTAAGVNIYLDGVLQGPGAIFTDNLTGNINSGVMLAIGRNANTGSQFFSGKMADVTIWNVELTQTDVTGDYNGGDLLETPIRPADNVFSWQGGRDALFSGGSNEWTFPDQSGNNFDGLPYSGFMEYADRDLLDYPGA